MAGGPARTPAQLEEVREFVRLLYSLSRCDEQQDFAKASGVHPVSLSKWITPDPKDGKLPAPDAYNLVRLLRGSGAMDLLQAAADPSAAQGSEPDLVEVRQVVGEILKNQILMMEDVTAIRTAQRPAGTAQPKPGNARAQKTK